MEDGKWAWVAIKTRHSSLWSPVVRNGWCRTNHTKLGISIRYTMGKGILYHEYGAQGIRGVCAFWSFRRGIVPGTGRKGLDVHSLVVCVLIPCWQSTYRYFPAHSLPSSFSSSRWHGTLPASPRRGSQIFIILFNVSPQN